MCVEKMKSISARPISNDAHCAAKDVGEQIVRIPLRILHEDPHQMRKTYNEEYIGLLADTIKVVGLLHPVAVLEEEPKRRYRIIAGHCRSRAFRMLGRKTIPARLFRHLDKETFLSIQISENTYQPVPPHEAAEKYHELYTRLNEKYGEFPLRKLSKVIGRSESALRDAMRFVRLNQKVKEYIKDGVLPYGAGVLLSEVDDSEAQNQMAVRAILTNTKVLVKHMENMIQSYHQSKVQTSMDDCSLPRKRRLNWLTRGA